MRDRLRFLYGADLGERAFADLERLLDRFRARVAGPAVPRPLRIGSRDASGTSSAQPGGRRGFDERDALLITYGDSFLAPGRPPLRALERFAVDHLSGLISGIHILPFFPYSSDYGFSVVDYTQVNPELGDWNDIASLAGRFELMFDVVLNHVSSRSAWFEAFLRGEPPYDRYFITVDPATDLTGVTRPRTTPLLTRYETVGGERYVWTTFSPDQVDLNYAEPAVLLRMIEVILTYVERGASLLRMDAVGYLWKEVGTSCIHLPQAHEVIKLFRDVLDAIAPEVRIVTETNVPHVDNVRYFGDGHDEAQMVYQFSLAPLVLDALARGDAARLREWAAGLVTPSEETTFFNFLASHDGVGVVPSRGILSDEEVGGLVWQVRRHGGEVSYKANPDGSQSPYELNTTFWDALSDPGDRAEPFERRLDRFVCSQAIMLALAGVPGIYVHSLFGSHNDHAGYARSGWQRDLNHERLDLADLEQRLADPSTETARVFGAYARLLAVRRAQPAFHPNAPQRVLASGPAVFTLARGPRDGQTILTLHNLSAESPVVDPGALGDALTYSDLLTDRTVPTDQPLSLAPYEVLWLA